MDGEDVRMTGQMTIFDFIPRPDDPIRNAILAMSPYWTTSRQKIIDAYCNGKDLTKVCKEEYCPYEFSGHYGGDFGKKGVFTLIGWDMRTKGIKFIYDPYMVETMTWAEFGKRIADLIRTGDYLTEVRG